MKNLIFILVTSVLICACNGHKGLAGKQKKLVKLAKKQCSREKNKKSLVYNYKEVGTISTSWWIFTEEKYIVVLDTSDNNADDPSLKMIIDESIKNGMAQKDKPFWVESASILRPPAVEDSLKCKCIRSFVSFEKPKNAEAVK